MSQTDLFSNIRNNDLPAENSPKLTVLDDGEFIFLPDFYPKSEGDRFFSVLKENVAWKQEAMQLYGKKVNFPRLTAWYGDREHSYSFSGITLQPLLWLPELIEIKNKIEQQANTTFNSVLLNLYRNGNDSISWHSDAEPELGVNPVIGSVNFGETRRFQLKHKLTQQRVDIDLTHGSALIMQGKLQHYWLHQVPKTSKDINERINLTFRYIKTKP